jgi:hypothetical protein
VRQLAISLLVLRPSRKEMSVVSPTCIAKRALRFSVRHAGQVGLNRGTPAAVAARDVIPQTADRAISFITIGML